MTGIGKVHMSHEKIVTYFSMGHAHFGRRVPRKLCPMNKVDFPALWDMRPHSRFGNTTDPTASSFLGHSRTYVNVGSRRTSRHYPSHHPTGKRPRAPLKNRRSSPPTASARCPGPQHSRRVPGHALSQHLRPSSVSHDGKALWAAGVSTPDSRAFHTRTW